MVECIVFIILTRTLGKVVGLQEQVAMLFKESVFARLALQSWKGNAIESLRVGNTTLFVVGGSESTLALGTGCFRKILCAVRDCCCSSASCSIDIKIFLANAAGGCGEVEFTVRDCGRGDTSILSCVHEMSLSAGQTIPSYSYCCTVGDSHLSTCSTF